MEKNLFEIQSVLNHFQSNVFHTIVFTVPDYNTIFMFLYNLLMSYPAVSRSFPVTRIATELASYPRQVVADIVTEVMTSERVLALSNRPLDHTEFFSVIAKYLKPKRKLIDLYHEWFINYVPLGIKRKLKIEKMKKADTKFEKL